MRLPRTIRTPQIQWPLFIYLTIVFFFCNCDLSISTKITQGYNPSEDEVLSMAQVGSTSHRGAIVGLGLIAAVGVILQRGVSRRIDGVLARVLVFFFSWSLLSVLWAQNTMLTFRSVITFTIFCLAAVAVARWLSLRQIVFWILFCASCYLLIGLLTEISIGTFHPFVTGYRFAGTLHPNSQGINCAFMALSATVAGDTMRCRPIVRWVWVSIGLGFLVLTESRTALVAGAASLFVYLATVGSRRIRLGLGLVLVTAVCGCLLAFWAKADSGARIGMIPARDSSRADSVATREALWDDIEGYIVRHPICGYGYGGFWNPDNVRDISDEEGWGVPDSHSTYYDQLLNLGAIGLGSYVLILITGNYRAFRLYRSTGSHLFAFCGALITFCALDGLFESAIAKPALPMFVCIVVLMHLCLYRQMQTAEVKLGHVVEAQPVLAIRIPRAGKTYALFNSGLR